MKKFNLHSLIFMTLLVSVTALLAMTVTATQANDNTTIQSSDAQQFPQEMQWLEWDGTTLISRTVQVFSAAEKEIITEWNRKNSEQAKIWQLYQSGQLPETPERDVIETEYGIVTVENTVTESNPIASNQEEISVEIEQVETPYGTITIEKRTFGESIGLDESDSGANRMGLDEYTDFLNQSCGSNGVEFNFGSNNTLSNYELHWSGGYYADYVTCASSCTFEVTTSWSAYYTYGYAYTTAPGDVHGFGADDYRCH